MHSLSRRYVYPGVILVIVAITLLQIYNGRTSTKTFAPHISTEKKIAVDNDIGLLVKPDSWNSTIRSWGCGIQLTPFVFIHIGKVGGGEARARISASALDYTKASWYDRDSSYYPVNATIKAVFCNSAFPHYRPTLKVNAFEGVAICHALTPLGQAIRCPLYSRKCPCQGTRCDLVYVGHNNLGNELHWLPGPYLEQWWKSLRIDNTVPANAISEHLTNRSNAILLRQQQQHSITHVARCTKGHRVIPDSFPMEQDLYEQCFASIANSVDSIGRSIVADDDWSPLYASLPVARVALIREPFSWLISKFFWHMLYKNAVCDDLDAATAGAGDLDRTKFIRQISTRCIQENN